MNFALILLIALLVTGFIALLDMVYFKKHRDPTEKEPLLIEYAKSFFPVILIVFALRSFVMEPFRIPSGSMIPTLKVGDFILVNKYTWGIRLPVANLKVREINQPQRGDVMVFRYPVDPSLDYIKRVVGLPGDKIEYTQDKRLVINGKKVPWKYEHDFDYTKAGLNSVSAKLYEEQLGEHKHAVLVQPEDPPVHAEQVRSFQNRANCDYNDRGFVCVVPPGHYFMMGDNRDDSTDSRYWGFVPDENIVGKAFFVWMNFSDFGRIGKSID
jgi:signal peptidase I